ncbi:MAG: PAS domain S-box protein, partial [Nanoarchaeota archaeon]|nr:PAS domain S-box protein [Nanoarchaeota archaeon]
MVGKFSGKRASSKNELREVKEKITGKKTYENVFFEESNEALLLIDLKGKIININKIYEKLYNLSKKDTIGKYVFSLGYDYSISKKKILKELKNLALGKKIEPIIIFAKNKKTKKESITETKGKLIQTNKGKQFLITTKDITKRVKSEQQQKENEFKFRNIVESAPVGIFTVNKKGIITEVNNKLIEMSGYSRDEMVNIHVTKFPTLRKREMPKYLPLIKEILQGKIPKPFDITWIHKDGTLRQGKISINTIRKDKKIIELQGILIENSDEEKIRKQIEESEEKYKQLFNSSQAGIITLNSKGFIETCNQAFIDLTGYKEKDFVGKHMTQTPTLDKLSMKQFLPLFKKVIRHKKNDSFEFDWKKKNGEIRTGEAKINMLKQNNKIAGLQCVIIDITERKKARKQIEESEENLKKIINSIIDGIIIIDPKGKVILTNDSMAKLIGYKNIKEGIGKNVMNFLTKKSRLKAIKDMVTVLSGQEVKGRYLAKKITGKEFWIETLSKRIMFQEKTAIILSVRDITHQK